MTGNHTYAHEARAHADSRQTCKAICPGSLSGSPSERYAFGMIYLIFTLFDIYFTAKTDMEPRQGGRFHIWHMLTREMPFCNLCASKDGTFERENCAPKRPARFRGLDLASAISSAPETITRPFLTAARMYILAKPVSLWTKQTKTPVSKGRGSNQWRLSQRQIARSE